MSNVKVTLHFDGTGICYDRYEPIHLDALLGYQLSGIHCANTNLSRSDVPEFVSLPLAMGCFAGRKIWRASAFFVDEDTPETVRHWRKKFRVSALRSTKGSPNLTSGIYREYNTPIPLVLARSVTAYCVCKPSRVRQLLSRIKFFGKKSSQGIGYIVGVDVDRIDYDWSWVNDRNEAMRWLPDKNGVRMVRTQPPYWNSVDRVKCCEIGDVILD